jgi:hypothetical protein
MSGNGSTRQLFSESQPGKMLEAITKAEQAIQRRLRQLRSRQGASVSLPFIAFRNSVPTAKSGVAGDDCPRKGSGSNKSCPVRSLDLVKV